VVFAAILEMTRPFAVADEKGAVTTYHHDKDNNEAYRNRLCAALCEIDPAETHKNRGCERYHETSDAGAKPAEYAPVPVRPFSIFNSKPCVKKNLLFAKELFEQALSFFQSFFSEHDRFRFSDWI